MEEHIQDIEWYLRTPAKSHTRERPISVTSNFDSGNIEAYTRRPRPFAVSMHCIIDFLISFCPDSEVVDASNHEEIKLRIRPEPLTQNEGKVHMQWFHFKVSNAKEKKCTYNIINAGEASFPEAWPGYNAAYSYDRKNWFRCLTAHPQL